ncbi:helix-turn-helix domain-containing protein [Collimonas humicola]|uniref:helix-turn-helix domain-containing protein n=1 Tax=Collimonas humicola TaxID=2825886 RepID=UPI001B8A9A46|nr:XRE family transcriptional regulator [Collimonas humicola]
MKTLSELSSILRHAKDRLALPVVAMSRDSGLTAVTIRGVLAGKNDPRLSTLMTIADQLGLELMLLPKTMASSIAAQARTEDEVQSLVAAALARPGSGQ